MARDQRDHYYRKAKEEGYRARSAYKLLQINQKFHIIKKGDSVVDLGAAPGGWLQVAKELSGGKVVGVDLEEIEPIPGVFLIKGDICKEEILDLISDRLNGRADVVLCDAAPNLSGVWDVDHSRSIGLARSALNIAMKLLNPQGSFLVKVFQGDMFPEYLAEVKHIFKKAQAHSPKASRKESAETYVVAKHPIVRSIRPGELCELQIESIGRSGDGVAFIDGFAIIVRGGSLGERVQVEIEEVKPSFAIGRKIERKN